MVKKQTKPIQGIAENFLKIKSYYKFTQEKAKPFLMYSQQGMFCKRISFTNKNSPKQMHRIRKGYISVKIMKHFPTAAVTSKGINRSGLTIYTELCKDSCLSVQHCSLPVFKAKYSP